jgi:LPXTG-site transpeptidase (sortase) family protein
MMPVPTSPAQPTSGPVEPLKFVPVRLRIPKVSIDAPIVTVSVAGDGSLGVPDDPKVIGWWRDGARPGDAVGSVVLDGHVDSAARGLGFFARLKTLQVGDTIEVTGAADGEVVRYSVSARRQYPKSDLPTDEVFSQGVDHRLVLVTCGGRFDRSSRHYDDNIVVYATPVS